MKKTLIVLIFAMIFVFTFTLCVSAADETEITSTDTEGDIILGDVDGDGQVTNADVLMIFRYIYNPELYPLPTLCEHSYGGWTIEILATCETDGKISRICEKCGETETSTVKGGHVYKETVVPPASSDEGYTLHECQRCGDGYTDTFVPPMENHSGLDYDINADGETCTITGIGSVTDTNVKIPSNIDGYAVTSIGVRAFKDCTTLESIIIPEGVSTIGNLAFDCCTNLTSITIPNSLTSIAGSVFFRCSNLASVYITDIESWLNINFSSEQSSPLYYGADLYLNDILLTSLVIPDSVTEILPHAFYNCPSIKDITIHDGLTSIGSKAFYNCASIADIYYEGTQYQWMDIQKGSSNTAIKSATIHYDHTTP